METMRRRVVITGMGVLSCAGANLVEFSRNIACGRCCLSPIDDPRVAHLKARYAGLLGSEATAVLERESGLPGADKHVRMAAVAAREALARAQLRPREFGRRLGLIFATCSGPMLLIEEHYERIVRGDPHLDAEALFAKQYHAGAPRLARLLAISGMQTTVVTACSASTGAIALAADLIRYGMLDAALAGGSDAFSLSTLAGFDGLKATCEGKCAPFSKPFGLNLGEAAAFVVLETPESAHQRGVVALGEIAGSGMSNDAHHCSSPEPAGRGLAAAMQRALTDAGLSPDQITYINTHGTGTEANDRAEVKALRKVFGARAERIPASSTKSMVGHCLGAAGAVEAIATLACAETGVLPPTANFTGPREGCAVDCVPEAGRPWTGLRTFLSNNSAFGGHNASLVITQPGDPPAPVPDSHLVQPIVITGCGVVSALGVGSARLIEGLQATPRSWRNVSLPGLPVLPAALVDEPEVERFDRRLDLRHMDRSSRWATVATRLAIREAGFPEKAPALAELGLHLHLATGPSWAESEYLTSFLGNNRVVREVAAFPHIVPSSVAGNVCRTLRLTGPNLTLSAGSGAGLLGLGPAVSALRTGHAGALLCGAVDELTDRILADRFFAGLITPHDAVPPGEGAAVLMLETETHAQQRGARPLATLRGLAYATDVGDPGAPDALSQVVEEALRQAGIGAGEVNTVCACLGPEHWEKLVGHFCPAWASRRVDLSPRSGLLEGAQPLLDLAAALLAPFLPGPTRHLLSVVSNDAGVNVSAVWQTP
jgi:3-oxoacyl-[acyl-carrier-protein] synthase II